MLCFLSKKTLQRDLSFFNSVLKDVIVFILFVSISCCSNGLHFMVSPCNMNCSTYFLTKSQNRNSGIDFLYLI